MVVVLFPKVGRELSEVVLRKLCDRDGSSRLMGGFLGGVGSICVGRL